MGFAKVIYFLTLLIALTLIGLAAAVFHKSIGVLMGLDTSAGNKATNFAGLFCATFSILAGSIAALASILGLILDRDDLHNRHRDNRDTDIDNKYRHGSSAATLASYTAALGASFAAFGYAVRMFHDRHSATTIGNTNDDLGTVSDAMGAFAIGLLPFVLGSWLASLLLKRHKRSYYNTANANRRVNNVPMVQPTQPTYTQTSTTYTQPAYSQQPAYTTQS